MLELRLILEAKNHVKDISHKAKMFIETERIEEAQEMLEIESKGHILKKNQAIYLSLLNDILAMKKKWKCTISGKIGRGSDTL